MLVDSRALTVAAAAAATIGAALALKKLLGGGSHGGGGGGGGGGAPLIPAIAPPQGKAHFYRLLEVDRSDSPWPKSHPGPPGQPAGNYLKVGNCEGELDLASVFEGSPTHKFILYSFEQGPEKGWEEPVLVFLELENSAVQSLYLIEAFIDRGVRKLVELGSRVAVVSLRTAEEFIRTDPVASGLFTGSGLFACGEGACELGVVWNTGRCGSTLLGKALIAAGAASLSEPHWSDQMVCKRGGAAAFPWGEMQQRRLLRACMVLEALLARRGVPHWRDAHCVVLNPKTGGANVAPSFAGVFPAARHVFMYRACHKVVESFGGLLKVGRPGPLARLRWALAQRVPRLLPPPLRAPAALRALSSERAAWQTRKWLDAVCGWLDLRDQRTALDVGGVSDPLRAAPALRMDEFTATDRARRAPVLAAALDALGALAPAKQEEARRAEQLYAADKVFAVHSQAGSAMSGPKQKFLADADVPVVHTAVMQALGGLGGSVSAPKRRDVEVQGGGANVLLAGSLQAGP